jgi:nucleoside-diphosphate-sugar epimerase
VLSRKDGDAEWTTGRSRCGTPPFFFIYLGTEVKTDSHQITGANGTIGYASLLYALQKGYRVRCIVRREDAIAAIRSGPSLKPYADRVAFAVVPDNTASGAYEAALAGVQYVVHIAGVWPKPNYHPDEEIYHPFVKSMENILSAAEAAGTVRRIVFTQAGAALVNPNDGDTLGTAMRQVLNGTSAMVSETTAY